MLDCTVHVPWTVQQALDLKKKKAKNTDLENTDAKSKQSLNIKINFYLQ